MDAQTVPCACGTRTEPRKVRPALGTSLEVVLPGNYEREGRERKSMAAPRVNLAEDSRSVTRTILLIAWPVFVEQILTTLVSYADTAMVGSLGAWATASVSISNAPIMLLNGVVMSLGVGITALVARNVGAGETETVKKLIRHAIMAIIAVGVPICLLVLALYRKIPQWMGAAPEILDTAAEYNFYTALGRIFMVTSMMINSALRGYGDTKTPLYMNTIMNIVNVILNFLLIYPTRELTVLGVTFTMWGAGWEVRGAAIATAVGMAVAGTLCLLVVFLRQNEYRIDLKGSWKPDERLTRQIFKISLPAMLERLVMGSSGVLVNSSVATLGTVNVAANSLSGTAESMSFMPAMAFQTAVTTLVGQSLGAKKPQLAEKYVRRTQVIGTIVMVFAGLGLFIFARQLIGFFTPDEEVIAIGAECLHVIAFMQIPQVLAWNFAGALRGAGDTKICFYIAAVTNWGVRTLFSVTAIRVFHQGLVVMQCIILAEILCRLCLLYWRYRSGKWKNVLAD